VLSPVTPATLDFGHRSFASWEVLSHYAATRQPLGLREPNPLDQIVVLQPKQFGARSFDSISQNFYWEVYDQADESLTLTLPFRDWTKESIQILEQLSPPHDCEWKFVVRLVDQDDHLFVEPISILRAENSEQPVFQLAFDTLPQANDAKIEASSLRADEETDESDEERIGEDQLPAVGSLSKVLVEVNRRLEAIAETGIHTGLPVHRDWFSKSRQDIHGFGLTALASVLDPLSSSEAVIRARYLTHLYSQATTHLVS
jgi:hypothetical protein